MNETITLSKTALINLLDTVANARAMRDFASAALNPQPLPPVAGPGPDPWASAFVARSMIDQAIAHYRMVERLPAEQVESRIEGVRSWIHERVKEWCETYPHPPQWPLPWPYPPQFDVTQLRPEDLLVAGAQFQKAANFGVDHPLQADFAAAADQLLTTGLNRLETR